MSNIRRCSSSRASSLRPAVVTSYPSWDSTDWQLSRRVCSSSMIRIRIVALNARSMGMAGKATSLEAPFLRSMSSFDMALTCLECVWMLAAGSDQPICPGEQLAACRRGSAQPGRAALCLARHDYHLWFAPNGLGPWTRARDPCRLWQAHGCSSLGFDHSLLRPWLGLRRVRNAE